VGALAAISFALPGLAVAGVAGGAVPIVIHLLHRRRFRRTPWAAMSFLLAANRRSRRRMQLEQWLLLALRTLAIMLLGLAAAGPFLTRSPWSGVPGRGTLRVLLLDNSCSMQAIARDVPNDETTRFDQARAAARQLLDSFPDTDSVSLITLASPAGRTVSAPTRDRRHVQTRLDAVTAGQRGTDLNGGLRLAAETIRGSEWGTAGAARVGSVVVYVISALTRAALGEDMPADAPADAAGSVAAAAREVAGMARLVLVGVGTPDGEKALDNAAITRFAATSPLLAVDVPVRFRVDVANFGPRAVAGLAVQVHQEDRFLRRMELPTLAPGKGETAWFSAVFDTAGSLGLEARLVFAGESADALAADNVRYASIETREHVPVLLVDGRPGAAGLAGAAGYLAMALAPRTAAGDRYALAPKVLAPYDLAGEVLSAYDVIALCDVPQLAPAAWNSLRDFVAAGGGLLVTLGEDVQIPHYNEVAYAGGEGVLAAELGEPSPPAGDERSTRLKHEANPHPVTSDFADAADSGLFQSRITRYVRTNPDPDRTDVPMRYENADPAILIRTIGRGGSCLFTTSADMTWTNLPAKGDYVSLMTNLVSHLVPARTGHRSVQVGEPLAEPLSPAGLSRPELPAVLLPDGQTRTAALSTEVGGVAATYAGTDKAGLYVMQLESAAHTFAANVDINEADLTPLAETALAERLACRFDYVSAADLRDSNDLTAPATDLSVPALALVLILLLGESWLAVRFGAATD